VTNLKTREVEAEKEANNIANFKSIEGKNSRRLAAKYEQLSNQIDIVTTLETIHKKLQVRRNVAIDKRACKKLKPENESSESVYFWPTKRYK